MLCSMCQSGTAKFWTCVCGTKHCLHVWACSAQGCGRSRYDGNEETRLGHMALEGKGTSLAQLFAALHSHKNKDVEYRIARFHTARTMFAVLPRNWLVVADDHTQCDHAGWLLDRGLSDEEVQACPRGFVLDHMVYWYQGGDFERAEWEPIRDNMPALGGHLRLSNWVPIYNGMIVSRPGCAYKPIELTTLLQKQAQKDGRHVYRFCALPQLHLVQFQAAEQLLRNS